MERSRQTLDGPCSAAARWRLPPGPRGRRILLLGAAPDTGNMGVTALCHGALEAILASDPSAQVYVADYGEGLREAQYRRPQGSYSYRRIGWKRTKRIHLSSSFFRVRLALALGGIGSETALVLKNLDLALDVSGGDSFTDLYGPKRFSSVAAVKETVLSLGIPLILLPQTYGPFSHPRARERASRIVAAADEAWARDGDSLHSLRTLLGPAFDPHRHRQAMDLAFALPPLEPRTRLPDELHAWWDDPGIRVHGLNVSGLIFNRPMAALRRFALRCDYPGLVQAWAERVLRDPANRLLLVPHVCPGDAGGESDVAACRAVFARIPTELRRRTALLPPLEAPGEYKWVIGRLAGFCGTRMHATIAALSSGVPTIGLAYSDKMRGVFDSAGPIGRVFDLRSPLTADDLDHPDLLLPAAGQNPAPSSKAPEARPR